MIHFYAPLELKFAPDDSAETLAGAFEGYGSVFGNVDSHGDMIMPGAFKGSLAEYAAQNRKISMYIQHGFGDPRPIGVWDSVEEDAKGLYVKGHVLGLDTETGRYHYALMKGGAMQGLSIGFRPVKADYPNEPGKPRRVIKEVKLREVSVVDQPSNPATYVSDIKSFIEEATSLSELERFLRNEYRMTRSEVTVLVSKIKSIDLSDSEEDDPDKGLSDSAAVKELAEAIRRNSNKLK